MAKVVWAEKYRPSSIEDFIGQSHIYDEFASIANGQPMQHFLFHSVEPGTGKTTMAYILSQTLGYKLIKYNASSKKQRGIEFVEEDLAPMARLGQYETIILLDEADQLTPAAQSALKGIIEDAQCFFILTCNDLNKISTWLRSRCQLRTFQPHTKEDIMRQLAKIAARESVEVQEYVLNVIATKHDGDMRNSIGALQAYAHLPADSKESFINTLSTPELDTRKILRLCFKEHNIPEAYKLISTISPRQGVKMVFDEAVNSDAKPENILRVIDAAVTAERDLINGVDEQIALYNFVKIMSS